MKLPRPIFNTFSICAAFLLFSFSLCQAEDIEGKYFTTIIPDSCPVAEFAKRINIGSLASIDSISSKPWDIKTVVSQGIDDLYLEVSDVLDIHMYSYHGKIKVFPTKQDMLDAALRGLSTETPDLPSLYIPAENTIYISFNDLTLGMLVHEMAHAIICNYFVTPPPPKVQEILSGYVEYSIRKKAGNLPVNKR